MMDLHTYVGRHRSPGPVTGRANTAEAISYRIYQKRRAIGAIRYPYYNGRHRAEA